MEDELREIAMKAACAEAAALLASRLGEDMRCVMMVDLYHDDEVSGSIYLHGHEDPEEMMGRVLTHTQAIFTAHGLHFQTMNIGSPGSG